LLIGRYSVILVDLFLPSTYQQVHVKIRKRMKISSQPRGIQGKGRVKWFEREAYG
jgi:hypothetical protein